MEHYWALKIQTKDTKVERICGIVFLKHKYPTQPTVTPVYAVAKSLKDLEKSFQGYLTQSDRQMEALEKLTENFTTTTATTTSTGTILIAETSPRVQRDAPYPRGDDSTSKGSE